MSMIGIGLGGFMDGFQKGNDIKMDRQRSKILDEQLSQGKKQAERQDMLNARDDAEWQRSEDQRSSIAKIGQDAQAKFNEGVKAGQLDPQQFDSFWRSYALPQIQNTYLASGDIDKAKGFMDWAKTADAERGGKLAMGAMFKANNGDLDGAMNDAFEVGKIGGYIDHGYEVLGHQKVIDAAGNSKYTVSVKGPDGKTLEQDILPEDVPRMIATWLNPQAAYESRVATQAAAAKDAKDLNTYEEKKKIDKKYDTGGGKGPASRSAAIEVLRKRYPKPDALSPEGAVSFDDMSREEQEKMIASEQALQAGTSTAPAAEQPGIGTAASVPRRVSVDTVTGQPVEQAPQRPAPAAAETAPAAIEKQAPADPKQSRQDNIDYMIEYAKKSLADRVPPLRIAEELQQNGIPPKMWPPEVTAAVARARENQIGLSQ